AAAPWVSASVFGTLTDGTRLIRIGAAALVCDGLLLVPLAYLRMLERPRLYIVIQLLKLILQIGLNILFLVPLAMGVAAILASTLITNGVFAALLIGFMFRQIRFRLSWHLARPLLRFSVPLVGTSMAMFVLHYCDRYFLQAAAGAATVGVYTL